MNTTNPARLQAMTTPWTSGRVAAQALACLALAATALASSAQTGWPADKPITMIVPFPPGGVADTVARQIGRASCRERV